MPLSLPSPRYVPQLARRIRIIMSLVRIVMTRLYPVLFEGDLGA